VPPVDQAADEERIVNGEQPEKATDNPAAERAEQPEEQQNVTEQVQEEAAKERESERGYQ
jgi:hypothetical protein